MANSTLPGMERWGGYHACNTYQDCVIGNDPWPYAVMFLCNRIPTAPNPRQGYCVCDFDLIDEQCGTPTSASLFRAGTFGIQVALAVASLWFCARELYHRARMQGDRGKTVVVAAILQTFSSIMQLYWGVAAIFFMYRSADFDRATLSQMRVFYANVAIPATFTFCLASTLVISLSWRAVCDSMNHRSKADVEAAARKRMALVSVFCVIVIVGEALVLTRVGTSAGAGFIAVCTVLCVALFYKHGRLFTALLDASVTVGDHDEDSEQLMHKRHCLKQAKRAQRVVTFALLAMLLVFLMLAASASTGVKLGGWIPLHVILISFSHISLVVVSYGITNYGRKIRLGWSSSQRKPRASTGASVNVPDTVFSSTGRAAGETPGGAGSRIVTV